MPPRFEPLEARRLLAWEQEMNFPATTSRMRRVIAQLRRLLPRQVPWTTCGVAFGAIVASLFCPIRWKLNPLIDIDTAIFEVVFFTILGGTAGLMVEWARLPGDDSDI